MSNSPITKRVQTAIYMKSALKQANNNEEENNETSFVDNPNNQTVVEGQWEETVVPGEETSTQSGLQGSYTGDDLYQGDYYSPDSPLGREMKKLGMTDITPESIKNYEQSKLIKNRQTGNTEQFGQVEKTDEKGNKSLVSDEDLQKVTDEQIRDRQVTETTQGPDTIEKVFKAKQVPQEFRVMGRGAAGRAGRGNKKAINQIMRQERSLGAFGRDKADVVGDMEGFSDKDRWTRKDKKLYAAKLAAGQDMGQGTGIGIGGQSYEKNKMVYQKNVGDVENQTYTNINDPKYKNEFFIDKDGNVKKKQGVPMKGPLKMNSPLQQQGKVAKVLEGGKKLFDDVKQWWSKSEPKVKKDPAVRESNVLGPDGNPVKVDADGNIVPNTKSKVNTKTETGGTKTDTGNTKTDTGNTKTDTGNTKTELPDNKNKGWFTKKRMWNITKRGTGYGLVGYGVGSMFQPKNKNIDIKPNITIPTGGGGTGTGTGTGTDTGTGTGNERTIPKSTTTKVVYKPTEIDGMPGDLPTGTMPKKGPGDKLSTANDPLTGAERRMKNKKARYDERKRRQKTNFENRQDRKKTRKLNKKMSDTFSAGILHDTNINNMGPGKKKKSPAAMSSAFKMGGYGHKAMKKSK